MSFLRLIHVKHPQFFFQYGFKFPLNSGNWPVEALRTLRGEKTKINLTPIVVLTTQRETITSFLLEPHKAAGVSDGHIL